MINQLFKIRYLFYFLLVGLANCNFSASKEIPSPAGYRFSDGQKIFLRSSLEEVSGISFVPGSDSVLMAVNDEEGKIFSVNIFDAKAKVEPFRFSDRGDYEDVAFYSGYWRILESKGIIHSVNMNEGKIPEPLKILPKGEYEGMAAENGNLYVACKDCPKDKDYTSTIYSFSTSGDSLVLQKVFVLDATEFLKGKKKKVLPSALAKNPVTGEWFILSHLNACLFITDDQFVIKEYYKLPRSILIQPEGIAFASNGDLFISSEGDEASGYIVRFNYNVQ